MINFRFHDKRDFIAEFHRILLARWNDNPHSPVARDRIDRFPIYAERTWPSAAMLTEGPHATEADMRNVCRLILEL